MVGLGVPLGIGRAVGLGDTGAVVDGTTEFSFSLHPQEDVATESEQKTVILEELQNASGRLPSTFVPMKVKSSSVATRLPSSDGIVPKKNKVTVSQSCFT